MRSGQGFADSLVLVVFLHECVPSAGSFLDFYAPDGVNNKIHAVILDVRVDGNVPQTQNFEVPESGTFREKFSFV